MTVTHTDTGLAPNTSYTYRVRVAGGEWSQPVQATTHPAAVGTGGAVWRFGVDLVSPSTREVLAQRVDVESMSVDWAYRAVDPTHSVAVADSTPRRTGSLRVRHDPAFNPLAVWYRPWVAVQVDDEWSTHPLGTFLCARLPGVVRDATTTTRTVPLAEVSARFAERRLTVPLSLPPGTNPVGWVTDDLQLRFGETDVAGITPSSKTLGDNGGWDHDWIVFDTQTPLIDVYDRLLAYVGYEPLRVDKAGRPVAHPARDFAEAEAAFTFGGDGAGLSPEVEIAPITPDLPNVVIFQARNGPSLAEDGNGWRTVRNETSGPGSIQQRGRVVESTVVVDADSQAELDAVARHRAPLIFAGGGWTLSATARATLGLDDCDVLEISHSVGASGRWLCTAYGFSARAGEESQIVDMSLQAELLAGAAFASDLLATPPAVATFPVASRAVAS